MHIDQDVGAYYHLLATLQLSSPALPVGSFSYSQGLEAAVETKLVTDEMSLIHWLKSGLTQNFGTLELPIWCMQHRHWSEGDTAAALSLDQWFLATRETRELLLETEQMGWSAQALIKDLWLSDQSSVEQIEKGVGLPPWVAELNAQRPVSYPSVMAALSVIEQVPIQMGCVAYAFAWVEAQVMAGSKAIPLGQASMQRCLRQLRSDCLTAASRALTFQFNQLQTFSPGLACLSSRHEEQYTRLFRS